MLVLSEYLLSEKNDSKIKTISKRYSIVLSYRISCILSHPQKIVAPIKNRLFFQFFSFVLLDSNMSQKLVASKRLKLEKIARLTLQEIRYYQWFRASFCHWNCSTLYTYLEDGKCNSCESFACGQLSHLEDIHSPIIRLVQDLQKTRGYTVCVRLKNIFTKLSLNFDNYQNWFDHFNIDVIY